MLKHHVKLTNFNRSSGNLRTFKNYKLSKIFVRSTTNTSGGGFTHTDLFRTSTVLTWRFKQMRGPKLHVWVELTHFVPFWTTFGDLWLPQWVAQTRVFSSSSVKLSTSNRYCFNRRRLHGQYFESKHKRRKRVLTHEAKKIVRKWKVAIPYTRQLTTLILPKLNTVLKSWRVGVCWIKNRRLGVTS